MHFDIKICSSYTEISSLKINKEARDICIYFVRLRRFLLILDTIDIL